MFNHGSRWLNNAKFRNSRSVGVGVKSQLELTFQLSMSELGCHHHCKNVTSHRKKKNSRLVRHGWASNLDFEPVMHLLLSERSFHRKPFLVRNQSYPWAIEFWPLEVLLPYILPAYFDLSQQLQLISALGTTISRSDMCLLCELAEECMLFGLHIDQRAYGNSKRWMSHASFVWLILSSSFFFKWTKISILRARMKIQFIGM